MAHFYKTQQQFNIYLRDKACNSAVVKLQTDFGDNKACNSTDVKLISVTVHTVNHYFLAVLNYQSHQKDSYEHTTTNPKQQAAVTQQ